MCKLKMYNPETHQWLEVSEENIMVDRLYAVVHENYVKTLQSQDKPHYQNPEQMAFCIEDNEQNYCKQCQRLIKFLRHRRGNLR